MKAKQKSRINWTIAFLCMSPVIIMLELFTFSEITMLIREQSDMAVTLGVVLIACLLIGNYGLFILIKSKTIKK